MPLDLEKRQIIEARRKAREEAARKAREEAARRKPIPPITKPDLGAAERAAAERKRRLQAILGQKKERDRRAAAAAAERKRRLQAALRRRVQHTVAKGEGIEQIGEKYGLGGKEALGQLKGVERLRPGQVLQLDVPVAEYTGAGRITPDPIRREKEYSGAAYKGERAQRLSASRAKQTELFGNQFGLGFGLGLAPQETPVDLPPAGTGAGVGALDIESALASGGGFIDTERELDRANLGRVQEKWRAIKKDEDFAAGQANLAQLIYGRLGEALKEGDLSKRVDYISPYVWSLFPVGLQEIYREQLGYYQRADGVWVPADFPEEELAAPEEDWGEGYGAGGGGRGGGGGGGGYKEETRTKGGSSYRSRTSGGRTRLDARQLTAGGMSPAKWRI